jgi:prepilin-type N-terminal cleavage/methylation domain-containing protein
MNKMSKGFTLIEVVISLVILAVALVPMIQMLPGGLIMREKIERITKITFLAQKKMEEQVNFFQYNFDHDSSPSFDPGPTDLGAIGFPGFKFKVAINELVTDKLKSIKVTVWYDTDSDGIPDPKEDKIVFDNQVASRG